MTTVKPIVEERQHHSWGLLVQGRPATPSEGRAQVSNIKATCYKEHKLTSL